MIEKGDATDAAWEASLERWVQYYESVMGGDERKTRVRRAGAQSARMWGSSPPGSTSYASGASRDLVMRETTVR